MISKIGLSETKSGGYRVGNVSNSPYLRQSGLQSGDVILSVNGQTLSNVQNDRTQLAGLMAGGTARLEIQRGDIRFTITASMPNSDKYENTLEEFFCAGFRSHILSLVA